MPQDPFPPGPNDEPTQPLPQVAAERTAAPEGAPTEAMNVAEQPTRAFSAMEPQQPTQAFSAREPEPATQVLGPPLPGPDPTVPIAPYVPIADASEFAYEQQPVIPSSPEKRKRSPLPWIFGGIALLLLIIGLAVLVPWLTREASSTSPGPTSTSTPTTPAPSPTPTETVEPTEQPQPRPPAPAPAPAPEEPEPEPEPVPPMPEPPAPEPPSTTEPPVDTEAPVQSPPDPGQAPAE
ncbi:MAG: hypothetical protein JWP30_1934 [Homoserinimonas sp.]|nr:hypothetical protein [Homoserinimonas sp.]